MLIILAILLIMFALAFTVLIRPGSLLPPEPESPTRHLEDRKATIYENLRDLQGEYLMGKLSDEDYQQTKADLQRELAGVLAAIEEIELSSEKEPGRSKGALKTATEAKG